MMTFRMKSELRNYFEKVNKNNPQELYLKLSTVKEVIELPHRKYEKIIKENNKRENIIKKDKEIYINYYIFDIINNKESKNKNEEEIRIIKEIFADNKVEQYKSKKRGKSKAQLKLFYRNNTKYIETKELASYIGFDSDELENIIRKLFSYNSQDIIKQQDNKYIPEYFLLNCDGLLKLKREINIDEKKFNLVENLL